MTSIAARTARAPSGAQIELRHGRQSVVIVEVGGGIRRYTAGGRDLLDGYREDERCTDARGQALIPWPNRLEDGRYQFDGQEYQLPLTEPTHGNAIHGLVRWVRWSATGQAQDRVTMTCILHPQSGWPFTVDLSLAYELGPEGLTVTATATNAGSGPCPFGAGAHPYLTLGTPTIDGLTLRSPGSQRMITNDRGIPVGGEQVAGTAYDFRAGRVIGDSVLDTGFCELRRGDDGRAWVVLADDRADTAVGLWLGSAYRYLMLFTGDSLPDPRRRRRALGVEPMTCPPNALRTGEGLEVLAPGESFSARWGLSPEPPPRS